MNSLSFQILSLFYVGLILFVYFSKKKLDTLENRIYVSLLIINFINQIVDMISVYLGIKEPTLPITNFFTKFYLVILLLWVFCFTYYIFVISSKKNMGNTVIWKNKNMGYFKKVFFYFLGTFSIVGILIFLFPLHVWSDGKSMYTYGPSAITSYATTFICLIIWTICLWTNAKSLKDKKYLPVFSFVILAGTSAVIQGLFPQILLVTSAASFITVLTYFTIENPDIKMIEQLNIARDQADKANNAKSEFLSNMSHEIRTPLNAIVGFSQALKEENLPEEAIEEVEDIISASSSLLEIVNGILDISKIEAGKLEIVSTEYSFKKVYNELVSLTKARIGDKQIEFRTHYDELVPPVLYGDHTRVKQVVLNLLTNAAKYTKEGYIELKVSTVIKNDICRLIISVEDSGIGIKNENISQLFSKFERFDLEKNITIEGTGLGLAITKKLMDLMKGKIVVQSVYGKGSKFTLAIDQKIVPKDALEEIVVESVDSTSFQNKKILVVDDNKLNLKVATRLLTPLGINVEEVDSGFACIEKIKEGNKYDLILLDDMMPKMSGIETLSYLKGIENFKIPCIALTANAISGMREKYINAGFDDYLSKPIDKNELNNVLSKFLSTEEKTMV